MDMGRKDIIFVCILDTKNIGDKIPSFPQPKIWNLSDHISFFNLIIYLLYKWNHLI